MGQVAASGGSFAELVNRTLLPGTARLGLGTGDLFQHPEGNAERVLLAAYEAGCRYIDTARLYGNGEAEHLIGRALGNRRQSMVIVSKAGIVPWQMRHARRLQHKLAGLAGPFGNWARIEPSFRANAFRPSEIVRSTETSLRALKTDYLDALLLHECSMEDAIRDDLNECLRKLQAAGKIRTFGTASSFDDICDMLEAGVEPAVLQGPADAITGQQDTYARAGHSFIVNHSMFRPVAADATRRIQSDPVFPETFLRTTGIDPRDGGALFGLCAAYALQANPDGIVLTSTLNPERAAKAWESNSGPPASPEQLTNFGRLLRQA